MDWLRVLACDYDGTLAHDGVMDEATANALQKFVASGRNLLMVTGRELDDLFRTCSYTDYFDYIVAENGAVLYRPSNKETVTLAEPPPIKLVQMLEQRGVPVSVGNSIVATWHPHEAVVLETIRDLGLENHVIFNKGAVMVLPAGVNKRTGMLAALQRLKLSPRNAVGVGDAENDHAFLEVSECAVAVSNALPTLKERADIVTRGDHGEGVRELVDLLLHAPREQLNAKLKRRNCKVQIAKRDIFELLPHAAGAVILGAHSDARADVLKSFAAALDGLGYQFLTIDPSGALELPEQVVQLGTDARAPTLKEIRALLEEPDRCALVNLRGVPVENRAGLVMGFLEEVNALRSRYSRPHWIMINECEKIFGSDHNVVLDPALLLHCFCVMRSPVQSLQPFASRLDIAVAVGEENLQKLQQWHGGVAGPFVNVAAQGSAEGIYVWRRPE